MCALYAESAGGPSEVPGADMVWPAAVKVVSAQVPIIQQKPSAMTVLFHLKSRFSELHSLLDEAPLPSEVVSNPIDNDKTPRRPTAPSTQIGPPSSQIGPPSSQIGPLSSQIGPPSSQIATGSSQIGPPSSQIATGSTQIDPCLGQFRHRGLCDRGSGPQHQRRRVGDGDVPVL